MGSVVGCERRVRKEDGENGVRGKRVEGDER